MDIDRFIYHEGDLVFPGDDICCKTCKYRKIVTDKKYNYTADCYRSADCKIYNTDDNEKPDGILFNNEMCKFYEKE